MQWQIVGVDALQFRTWDDETVIYNQLSGALHILEDEPVQILKALQHAPLSTAALASLLAARWNCESNEEFVFELDQVLQDLHALSLIGRLPS